MRGPTGSLFLGFDRTAQLVAVVFDQGVAYGLQVAGHDLVELVERQIDAVVGQAVFGKVVGANPLAAIAGADLGLPLVGPLFVFLTLLLFVDPRS